MKLISVQSGSNGNCVYVEAGGVRLLFDAGVSGWRVRERLSARGRHVTDIDALLISHDHLDHTRCMGIYHRQFGLPVYVTQKTLEAARARYHLGKIADVRHFPAGATLRMGSLTVETIPTAHDSPDGVAFVLDDGRRRLGILTDLGHVFQGLRPVIRSLDAVFLESNYDPDLLAGGPYPEFLKQRIRGPGGHLSNIEAAQLLEAAADNRLQWACLAHLSEQNNDPQLALQTHRQILGRRLPLYVASRHKATEVLQL